MVEATQGKENGQASAVPSQMEITKEREAKCLGILCGPLGICLPRLGSICS